MTTEGPFSERADPAREDAREATPLTTAERNFAIVLGHLFALRWRQEQQDAAGELTSSLEPTANP